MEEKNTKGSGGDALLFLIGLAVIAVGLYMVISREEESEFNTPEVNIGITE